VADSYDACRAYYVQSYFHMVQAYNRHGDEVIFAACVQDTCPKGKYRTPEGSCVDDCGENSAVSGGNCVCQEPFTWKNGKCSCPTGSTSYSGSCACASGKEMAGHQCCANAQVAGDICCPSDKKGYCAAKDSTGKCTNYGCCPGEVSEGEGVNNADICLHTDFSGCRTNAECSGSGYCLLTANRNNGNWDEWRKFPRQGSCEDSEDYTPLHIDGLGDVIVSNNDMPWWAAVNYCKANNKELVDIADIGCYIIGQKLITEYSGMPYDAGGTWEWGCCAKGQGCWNEWHEGWYNQAPERYSPVMRSLNEQLGNDYITLWTASMPQDYNDGQAYCFNIRGGSVRSIESDGWLRALCK